MMLKPFLLSMLGSKSLVLAADWEELGMISVLVVNYSQQQHVSCP